MPTVRSFSVFAAVVMTAAWTAAPVAAAPLFERLRVPSRVESPRIAGIEDRDGDGDLDIIFAGDDGIHVADGDAAGRYSGWRLVGGEGLLILGIGSGDIDGDGRLDLVVDAATDHDDAAGSKFTRVYLARGDEYVPALDLPAAAARTVFGDADGDGALDLIRADREWITADSGLPQPHLVVDVLRGDGAGGFAPPRRSLVGTIADAAIVRFVGDVNSDGRADVVMQSSLVLYGQADGSMLPAYLELPPLPGNADDLRQKSTTAADIDGDGHTDVIGRLSYPTPKGVFASEEVTVFWYGRPGGFEEPVVLPEIEDSKRTQVNLFVADVNEDGRLDLLHSTTNPFSPGSIFNEPTGRDEPGRVRELEVYLATGPRSFAISPIISNDAGGMLQDAYSTSSALARVDLDADGHVDHLTSGTVGLRISYGDGTGSFPLARILGTYGHAGTHAVVTADFDNDGDLDLALAPSGSFNVSVWLGDGNGGLAGPTIYDLPGRISPRWITSGDVDGDGDLDLAVTSVWDWGIGVLPGIALLLGDGDGGFTVGERFDFGDSVGGEILDVDLDGKADLAFAENSQRQVTVVFDVAGERNVVGFADPQGINEGLHPDQRAAPSLAVGDFDENGYPDLVRPSFTPVVNIFKNVGDPTNRSVVRIDLGDDPRAVAVADLDADGHDDLLFGHWTVEEQAGVIVLLGDGTGGFANHGRYSLGGANLVYNLGVAPLDTTGQLYVISAFYDQVRLLPVLPGGSLGAPIEIGRPDHSTLRLAVADLDGDGLPEIVTPNYVFRNRGDCGNGTVTEGEACDDGNGETCDGCDASCRIEIGTLCGDGVVSSDCDEQCDDGDLNADAPDRCRSSCRLPACGDGIVDTGEQCDDGNTESCDGCSATCVVDTIPVCGDGVLDVFCGEHCDDGGTVYGDGCDGRCLVEHAPGGGGRKTDCLLEWIIDNPTNDPLYDRRDRISSKQICRDNDPDCDADGGVTGTCTFRVSMCLAVADGDYPDCGPARMSALEIRRPSTRELAKNPGAGPVRERVFAAFEAAATGPAGSCSDLLELPVPMRRNGTRPGRLVLKVGATSADGRRDHDALRFKCVAR